jgi:purine-binding chemotaxis protein CheW
VSDIITVTPEDIRAVPDIGASVPERLLAGLIPREHGMVSLVSLESLLAMSDDIAARSEPTPTLS